MIVIVNCFNFFVILTIICNLTADITFYNQ